MFLLFTFALKILIINYKICKLIFFHVASSQCFDVILKLFI